jgi:hypothetical protein
MIPKLHVTLTVPANSGITAVGWYSGLPSHIICKKLYVDDGTVQLPLKIQLRLDTVVDLDFTNDTPNYVDNFPDGFYLQNMEYLPTYNIVKYTIVDTAQQKRLITRPLKNLDMLNGNIGDLLNGLSFSTSCGEGQVLTGMGSKLNLIDADMLTTCTGLEREHPTSELKPTTTGQAVVDKRINAEDTQLLTMVIILTLLTVILYAILNYGIINSEPGVVDV